MATFKFRFETLLNHRGRIEDQCQRQLAKHLRTRAIMHEQLRNQQQTIHHAKRDLAGGLAGKVDLAAVGQFARYSSAVTSRARQMVNKLVQLEPQIDSTRKELLNATQQRKALDMLRDKHHDQWRRDQQRRETAEMDELTTQRYARRIMIGGAG